MSRERPLEGRYPDDHRRRGRPARAGVADGLDVVLAELATETGTAIEALAAEGCPRSSRPTADRHKEPRPGRRGGLYDFMPPASLPASAAAEAPHRRRHVTMNCVRADQGQPRRRPVPAPRPLSRQDPNGAGRRRPTPPKLHRHHLATCEATPRTLPATRARQVTNFNDRGRTTPLSARERRRCFLRHPPRRPGTHSAVCSTATRSGPQPARFTAPSRKAHKRRLARPDGSHYCGARNPLYWNGLQPASGAVCPRVREFSAGECHPRPVRVRGFVNIDRALTLVRAGSSTPTHGSLPPPMIKRVKAVLDSSPGGRQNCSSPGIPHTSRCGYAAGLLAPVSGVIVIDTCIPSRRAPPSPGRVSSPACNVASAMAARAVLFVRPQRNGCRCVVGVPLTRRSPRPIAAASEDARAPRRSQEIRRARGPAGSHAAATTRISARTSELTATSLPSWLRLSRGAGRAQLRGSLRSADGELRATARPARAQTNCRRPDNPRSSLLVCACCLEA